VLDTDSNAGNFTLHSNGSPGCFPVTSAPIAPITPYFTRIFYISTCSGTNCASSPDNIPTLKRIDITPAGASTPVSIVDGIENLQFDYGIDTTAAPGDGSPDIYKNPPLTFAEWQNVMTVRIYLLARNLEASSGFKDTKTYALGPVTVAAQNDAFRRHVYTQLVRVYNPSQRRE
jgi:type IV pilus assembly protein PilW